MRDSLFQEGSFTLASGKQSEYKIECDNLTDEEIHLFAYQLSKIVPPFQKVVGVPTGGLRLAEAMSKYEQGLDDSYDHSVLLVVDDVWTTGRSMSEYIKTLLCSPDGKFSNTQLVVDGESYDLLEEAVIFQRGPDPDGRFGRTVTALWKIHPQLA